jgi:hypothetical protein
MSKIILLGTLFLTAAATAPAHAQFPARLRAGDAQLVLNCTGARSKYLMQMYEAGLYLLSPSGDAGAIVAADGPMAIRLHITSGLVTQEKLVESLNEGFENSTGGKPETLSKEIGEFRGMFAAEIKKGDVFDLVYLPTHGTVVLKNGERQGAVPGLAFKQALFGIWLGEKPADDKLRVALLKK